MTDAEKTALIVRAARAIWHATPGAENWDTLDEDDEHRAIALTEAEAAVDEMGFFSPAKMMTDTTDLRDAAAHLAATLRKMLNPPSTLPTPQQLELWDAIDAVEKLVKEK
jgi:hypothetical protein